MRSRPTYLACAMGVVAVGLVWRLVPMGMPMPLVRRGGAALWGAMVFLLVAAGRPRGWGRIACLTTAALIAVAAELFRLYYAPALDAFRGTLAGALLVGRVFAPINILVYCSGILVAALLDRWTSPSPACAACGRRRPLR